MKDELIHKMEIKEMEMRLEALRLAYAWLPREAWNRADKFAILKELATFNYNYLMGRTD